ncbi:MAG: hypothetical protein BZY81_08585 [SAR202 cluster bacterium Io17-Chloro-G4]|nr:MAG: hypothetical protein BZY81_08585 [SAR202 cluster bacterium Io17-Chloro-G4]
MDSDKETVLLVGQNLFFLGRVEMLAEPLGLAVERATTEAVFMDHYTNRRLALVLIDLEGDESVWSKVLENIGHVNGGGFDKERGVNILAFGPHENVALLERARELGCDLVLNKGEFNRDLPKIIEKLGADLG